jgi:hypothetical protein
VTESEAKAIVGVRPDGKLALTYALTDDTALEFGQRVRLVLESRILGGVVIIAPTQMLELEGVMPTARAERSDETEQVAPDLTDAPALLTSLNLPPGSVERRRQS